MEALGVAANVAAMIDLTGKVAALCFQYSKDVKNAKSDIQRLTQEINTLQSVSKDVEKLLRGPQSSSLPSLGKLDASIQDGLARLESLEDDLDPGKRRKTMSSFGLRALKWPFDRKDVERLVDELRKCSDAVNSALQIDQTTVLLSMEQKAILEQLPVADGAMYQSHAEQHNPTCLPDTRLDVLEQISTWTEDPDGKTIFWLNGMAGTGKSTISRTVAKTLSGQGQLGASFFFKRGEADRGGISKFSSTVARQLVQSEPRIMPMIKEAIDSDFSLLQSAAQNQFSRLILEPFWQLPSSTPLVVVVDALDECDNDNDIKLLINLFSRANVQRRSGIKFLVTSRPELPIRLGFNAITNTHKDLVLHQIDPKIIEHDIRAFLEDRLGLIRHEWNSSVSEDRKLPSNWPSLSQVQDLVEMAVPLFIFAATACRFISDRQIGTPDMQLEDILKYKGNDASTQLDATYLPILDRLTIDLPPKQKDRVINQFKYIVGTILVLENPLSISALANMLDVSQHVINLRLDWLHSVLDVPPSTTSPIRLLHLSFRDFLLDPSKRQTLSVWIDEKQANQTTAEACLQYMSGGCLKKDMCDIKYPGTPRKEIEAHTINACLPPELQYCCLYWIHHVEKSGSLVADDDGVSEFLMQHCLHWLEALSLMGRVSESINLLRRLQLLLEPDKSHKLSSFLGDISRSTRIHLHAIDIAPLQLYSSLLLFSPSRSTLRDMCPPSWVSLRSLVPLGDDYSLCFQTLEGHKNFVESVIFSHDSSLVASTSIDQTVRIWLTDTGQCIHILQHDGSSASIEAICFSNDSAFIVSVTGDQVLRTWDVSTGECVRTILGKPPEFASLLIAYSMDFVAIGDLDDIQLRRVDTGVLVHTLEDPGYPKCFSDDSTLFVATSSSGGHVYSTSTGECITSFGSYLFNVTSIAFSPDSTLLAFGLDEGMARILKVETGETLQTIQEQQAVSSLAFSHDSKLLAIGLLDSRIRILDVHTGEYPQALIGHRSDVRTLCFSHDSKLVASGSSDRTINVWSTSFGRPERSPRGSRTEASGVIMSPDRSVIATNSYGKTLTLWSSTTGNYLRSLEGSSYYYKFSRDSALLASRCGKEVRIWRVQTGECILEFSPSHTTVQHIDISGNASTLASVSSGSQHVELWSVDTGERLHCLQGHSTPVVYIAFSHDSKLLVSGSYGNSQFVVHCVFSGKLMCIFDTSWEDLLSADLCNNSNLLVVSGAPALIQVWQFDTGESMPAFGFDAVDLYGQIELAVLSNDAKSVAALFEFHDVLIWDVESASCLQCFNVGEISSYHPAYEHCISFSLDDKFLKTERGNFALNAESSIANNRATLGSVLPRKDLAGVPAGFGISSDKCWVTWKGDHLLWLPMDYRPFSTIIEESTVIIGSPSGVLILDFSEEAKSLTKVPCFD